MTTVRLKSASTGRTPYLDGRIYTTRGDTRAIWCPRSSIDIMEVTTIREEKITRCNVPDLHIRCPIATAGNDRASVRRPCDGIDVGMMTTLVEYSALCPYIPDLYRTIGVGRGNISTVR